jgi:hypothetical protein
MLQLGLEQGGPGALFGTQAGMALGGSGENKEYRTGAAEGPEGGGLGRGKLTPVPRALHGIILVSNSMGTLPEAEGVLSGNPIYTVYLEVPGAPRKWILQFCVPKSQAGTVELSAGIVHVLSRKPLDPPYAVHRRPLDAKFVPTLERISQLPQRVVVYSHVDAEGNLRDARIIRGADSSTDELVLANLREWEFLPAFRDGEPVEVEAVFGIPLY